MRVRAQGRLTLLLHTHAREASEGRHGRRNMGKGVGTVKILFTSSGRKERTTQLAGKVTIASHTLADRCADDLPGCAVPARVPHQLKALLTPEPDGRGRHCLGAQVNGIWGSGTP